MKTTFRATGLRLATALLTFTLTSPASAQPGVLAPPAVQTPAVGVPAAQPAEPAPWLKKLTAWLRAVSEHKPGRADGPAKQIGLMTAADLDAVRGDLLALLDLCRRERERGQAAVSVTYKHEIFALTDIEKLLDLTTAEGADPDANQVLKRAAILHVDVAMLVVPFMVAQVNCPGQQVLVVQDGRPIGNACRGIHWEQGRALLDAVRPHPGRDDMVRLWYQATIAYLLEIMDYTNGIAQIDRASVLFPNDPGLLFEHGCYHEAFASPHVQQIPVTRRSDRREASAHLKEAEALFRRALEWEPDFVEARVHHGAVLAALHQHDDAVLELRKAVVSARGPVLRYYAELFLGNEEQTLGNQDAARARYEEAAALFPSAQSPRIALSALARQGGDRIEALAAVRQVLNLPAEERRREDPWWSYYFWVEQNSWMRLRDLDRLSLAGGPR